jgi:hypothetical protein
MICQVLEAQGKQVMAPWEREHLHPLVIPLAQGPVAGTSAGSPFGSEPSESPAEQDVACIGLLRWPEGAASRVSPFQPPFLTHKVSCTAAVQCRTQICLNSRNFLEQQLRMACMSVHATL